MLRLISNRKKHAVRFAAACFASLAACSCFSSARRISFAGEGEKQAAVELTAGEVRYAGYFRGREPRGTVARYGVDLLQAGRVVSHASCDLLPIKDDRQCVFRFSHDRECNVVMSCSGHLDAGGPTVVRARLSIPTKPAEFRLDRADLIVGQ